MPSNKDLKRLVRARMEKTGERYTTARSKLLNKQSRPVVPVERFAEIAGMSDAAVLKRTGRNWQQWVDALDQAEAVRLPHREIALMLNEDLGVPGWWAQMVTVAYERIKGLRDIGQRRGGRYDVNKSKVVGVPIQDLYRAFSDPGSRQQWMGDIEVTERTCNENKSIRWLWDDGTPVNVNFYVKGEAKSQAQIQHLGIPDKAQADQVRAQWGERIERLVAYLRS